MTSTMPSVVRLAEIKEKSELMSGPDDGQEKIHYRPGNTIELHNVSMFTPGRELQLLKHLTLSIPRGATASASSMLAA